MMKMYTLFITLSGGEPLLHPQFWDILKTIQESGVRNILLITNATLINSRYKQNV